MIIIPSILESYRSLKDKTLKINFETNELNPQELLGIVENLGAYGYLAFKKEPFNEKERQQLESLETTIEDSMKTPSQRLRAVLYRNFERDAQGFKSFATYYEHQMELLLNHFKSKLQ
jgi:hypothetical protein